MKLLECLLLYLGLPSLLAFLPGWVERRLGVRLNAWVIPTLLVASAIAYAHLRRTGRLARGEATRLGVGRRDWTRMLTRFAIGAAFFAWAHIVFHNVWACAFTFVGGLFFLSTYRRTGSLLFAAVEHALYGDFLFSIGWGAFFYEGTQAALAAVGA